MSAKLFIVQRDEDGLFQLPDGQRVGTADLPPGAMWRAGADGPCWTIRLPGEHRWADGHIFANIWNTCSKAGDGQGWDVTGEAPNLTVTPSIWCSPNEGPERGEWHGFITAGEITP